MEQYEWQNLQELREHETILSFLTSAPFPSTSINLNLSQLLHFGSGQTACYGHPNAQSGKAFLLHQESPVQKRCLLGPDFLASGVPPQWPQVATQMCPFGWAWCKQPEASMGPVQRAFLARTFEYLYLAYQDTILHKILPIYAVTNNMTSVVHIFSSFCMYP